jgi:hypothetical protein
MAHFVPNRCHTPICLRKIVHIDCINDQRSCGRQRNLCAYLWVRRQLSRISNGKFVAVKHVRIRTPSQRMPHQIATCYQIKQMNYVSIFCYLSV